MLARHNGWSDELALDKRHRGYTEAEEHPLRGHGVIRLSWLYPPNQEEEGSGKQNIAFMNLSTGANGDISTRNPPSL
jgi:hypothetical protein